MMALLSLSQVKSGFPVSALGRLLLPPWLGLQGLPSQAWSLSCLYSINTLAAVIHVHLWPFGQC